MKKHIKNAAGALLLFAAILTACVAFQDAQEAPFAAALGHWPLLVLTAVLAFSGVFLVDTRPTPKLNPIDAMFASMFQPARGVSLDRQGARYGVTRRARKTFTLPFAQVRIMESDDRFRQRVHRAANTASVRRKSGNAWEPNTKSTDRGNRP